MTNYHPAHFLPAYVRPPSLTGRLVRATRVR